MTHNCDRCGESTSNKPDEDDYLLCDDCKDEWDAKMAKDD